MAEKDFIDSKTSGVIPHSKFYEKLSIFNIRTGEVSICAYDSFEERPPLAEFRPIGSTVYPMFKFNNTCDDHIDYEKILKASLETPLVEGEPHIISQ